MTAFDPTGILQERAAEIDRLRAENAQLRSSMALHTETPHLAHGFVCDKGRGIVFRKVSGALRFLVEDDEGNLSIMGPVEMGIKTEVPAPPDPRLGPDANTPANLAALHESAGKLVPVDRCTYPLCDCPISIVDDRMPSPETGCPRHSPAETARASLADPGFS